MRNLHTCYNPTIEELGNSEHAEFLCLFLSTGIQVKEPKNPSMKHSITTLNKNLVAEMPLKKIE
jgi:hypothetical protein